VRAAAGPPPPRGGGGFDALVDGVEVTLEVLRARERKATREGE
jgi:hypothetical protein